MTLVVRAQIEVLAWKQDRSVWDLTKVAFFDAYSYVTDIVIVKSFIVFGDAHKSVHFLRLTVRSKCRLMLQRMR